MDSLELTEWRAYELVGGRLGGGEFGIMEAAEEPRSINSTEGIIAWAKEAKAEQERLKKGMVSHG